jgi:hypothetical protein
MPTFSPRAISATPTAQGSPIAAAAPSGGGIFPSRSASEPAGTTNPLSADDGSPTAERSGLQSLNAPAHNAPSGQVFGAAPAAQAAPARAGNAPAVAAGGSGELHAQAPRDDSRAVVYGVTSRRQLMGRALGPVLNATGGMEDDRDEPRNRDRRVKEYSANMKNAADASESIARDLQKSPLGQAIGEETLSELRGASKKMRDTDLGVSTSTATAEGATTTPPAAKPPKKSTLKKRTF